MFDNREVCLHPSTMDILVSASADSIKYSMKPHDVRSGGSAMRDEHMAWARTPAAGTWPRARMLSHQRQDRPAVCAHDVRGPLRQACCCCGACDHLDFRFTDEAWRAVIPVSLDGGMCACGATTRWQPSGA